MKVVFNMFLKLTDKQDKMQRTPVYLAAKYNHLEVMEILLKE